MTTNETPQGVTAEGDDYSARIGGNSSAADRGKSGQGSGTETRPRNIAMMFIIKV